MLDQAQSSDANATADKSAGEETYKQMFDAISKSQAVI
jgi:hypothetical protein